MILILSSPAPLISFRLVLYLPRTVVRHYTKVHSSSLNGTERTIELVYSHHAPMIPRSFLQRSIRAGMEMLVLLAWLTTCMKTGWGCINMNNGNARFFDHLVGACMELIYYCGLVAIDRSPSIYINVSAGMWWTLPRAWCEAYTIIIMTCNLALLAWACMHSHSYVCTHSYTLNHLIRHVIVARSTDRWLKARVIGTPPLDVYGRCTEPRGGTYSVKYIYAHKC